VHLYLELPLTSGAYPFVLSRRAVRVVDVLFGFARKLIEKKSKNIRFFPI
jgi:hypothetical protein